MNLRPWAYGTHIPFSYLHTYLHIMNINLCTYIYIYINLYLLYVSMHVKRSGSSKSASNTIFRYLGKCQVKLLSSQNIGAANVSKSHLPCNWYISPKEIFTRNYVILKCWMNTIFDKLKVLTKSKKKSWTAAS